MGKFRVRLKLQGLELEIDGERGDIPAITSAVQQEFSSLIKPAEVIADGRGQLENGGQMFETQPSKNKGRAIRRRGAKQTTEGRVNDVLEYKHDPSTYGNPQQSWSQLEKVAWVLAVIKGATATAEVSVPQLAATFNQYYKPSGKLHLPTVTRELGKAKVQNPSWFGEDKGLWDLTEEGERQAQRLIQSNLNSQTTP